ncbi:multiple epidermal growth factor-like domains protein 10 [Stegostoma tigrinum]|uniref:multiple epidermal growth factor-like domains protein 10 n=1 Tax=Stegostoma tigrinum TaxID=3053191 RepID=UPI00287074B3|nr:multiple epidermal growth factor-like domains protein 10 [Stegostoma tigrinum]XP_059499007.1 multiple epidermal growth factor-like domains protein 10 [Stegostoma tigrinum]XP_059499008.1 multiple epidermal growth factor-like domains protein 10 [Stegostoma tigrinum]XP_059499009.1 multiple epidermal growth factor-like domains protein 10 [Stegostoma tigrinum]XP_059499010.1 multiple epidermal growth factor-like domains protein 10 [Stegostoma tigrinum]
MEPLWTFTEALLLCCLLPSACPLNPSDPNVCSRWESYSVTKQESFLAPHDEPYEEDCDDPRTHFRCARHKITYRMTYHVGVQTEYRKRAHCCPGYYESRGICVPQCAQECVHGRCLTPDQCQCAPEWRGQDCSSDCSALYWGTNCSQKCACRNGGQCDPLTGLCSCPPGYTGLACEDPCRPGTYGQDCSRLCQCRNGARCDRVTGACECVNGTTGGL